MQSIEEEREGWIEFNTYEFFEKNAVFKMNLGKVEFNSTFENFLKKHNVFEMI